MDFAHLTTQELTVSFASSLDTKERVKQAIDIVELVSKYVQLRRQGRAYVGLCPWHDDTRPSLQVNPERQSFKCWVCDIGGDVFSFVMQMDGVTFPEALAMLADQAGIPLKPARGASRATGESTQDKRALYRAMAWAEKQYHECLLNDPEAEPARRYLHDRAITPESIEKFHLGFSPNRWDWLLRRAQTAGLSGRLLEAIGLLAASAEGGNPYDRFRGRVLFSIRDAQGRPIGFGGRVLPESGSTSPAKYINSPETPLFRKSENLYGLDVARDPLRKSGTALVMEGYTDCIIAHQHGFPNAVAVLGTALGPRHIQVLKRFADRVVLVLDGDEAGQRRANEVLQLFVGSEADLRVAIVPDGLDPCDLLIQRGAEAFREVISAAVDALEHKFRVSARGLDLERDIQGVNRALEETLALIAAAPRLTQATDAQRRNREWTILGKLAMSFRVPQETVFARLRELRSSSRRREAAGAPAGVSAAAKAGRAGSPEPIDPWQRELLEILIRYPDRLGAVRPAIRPEQLASAPCRAIYETCCRLADGGAVPSFDRLMLELDDPALKSLIVELDESGSAKRTADPGPLLEELIRSFQKQETVKQHPAKTGLLREKRLDEGQELAVLREIVQEERTRQGISEPTDG